MEKQFIDINCDVGEGIGNEPQLFPFITSCNIACGGHAGDEQTMEFTVRLALAYKVKIGAHPSYPDKENFGRISMNLNDKELSETIIAQVKSLISILKKENTQLHHIKPHGALYNDIAKNEKLALVFLTAIEGYKNDIFLYVPFASVVEKLAIEKGFRIKREAFGDRNYTKDLRLVSRKAENALITEPHLALQHIITMAKNQQVKTVSEEMVPIEADTFCIHGDTPFALQILMYLSEELPNHNIYLKK